MILMFLQNSEEVFLPKHRVANYSPSFLYFPFLKHVGFSNICLKTYEIVNTVKMLKEQKTIFHDFLNILGCLEKTQK